MKRTTMESDIQDQNNLIGICCDCGDEIFEDNEYHKKEDKLYCGWCWFAKTKELNFDKE